MCGIVGYLGRDWKPDLARLVAALAHRGPDSSGTEELGEHGLGLGHTRLAIQDLSETGHQPMWDPDRRACVTYNGEIYNSPELRRELEADGVRFRGRSDTEVLLHLYLRDGREAVRRLNGIFAFAIWDARERELFVARDHLGVKPLYYASHRGTFLFASELKALADGADLPREIDPRAVLNHLVYLWSPAPATMLCAVRKLEPGTWMRVKDGAIAETRRYFGPADLVADPVARSDAEAAELVLEKLRGAVRRQLLSDVPVGSFLSGGVDSSAIVTLASEQLGADLPCFTAGAAGGDGVESDLAYARQVAGDLGVPLHEIPAGERAFELLADVVAMLDEPQGDVAPIFSYQISKAAREAGITVLLSGAGGDDVFSGYRRHLALHHARLWSWLPGFVRGGLQAGSRRLPVRMPLFRRLRKLFENVAEPADSRLCGYFRWLAPALAGPLLAPGLRAELDEAAADGLERTLAELPAGPSDLRRSLVLEQRHFLADHNLNYTDKTGMACGVEIRVPFLDLELLEAAATIPDHQLVRGSQSKWILKRALAGVLPEEILWRPKAGFGAPVREWLTGPLAGVVSDLLSEENLAAGGLFDPGAVRRLVAANHRGELDASYTILSLVCMEFWRRRFAA